MRCKSEIHRPDSPERKHYLPKMVTEIKLYPKLFYSGRLECSSKFCETLHSHPFLEVLLINSGTGTIIIDNETFPAKQGDIVIFNAGVKHTEISVPDDPLETFFFGVGNIAVSGLPENTLFGGVYSTKKDFPFFQFCSYNLVRECKNELHYSKEITESLVHLILVTLFRLLPSDGKNLMNNSIYYQAKNYIDEYFIYIKSVDDICKPLHISNYYLSHIFKRYNTESPMQYVIKKRIELAKSLLANTDLSIEDVSLRCGYDDKYYFYRVFNNRTKTTPAQYRKNIK